MTFLWPSMLVTLLIIPLIVAVYLWLQKRRRVVTASFNRFGGLRAKRPSPGFRRHVPPLLSLMSLAVILVALARPQAEVRLPRIEGTVILVFDVSASMGATDVQPSRLEAAKKSARDFVLSQPETVKIGIVSFSSSGFTVQAPTNDPNALLNTIERLQPTSGTSLGQGIVTALRAIAVDAGLAKDQIAAPSDAATPEPTPGAPPGPGQRQQDMLAQLPDGAYPSSVIVLLSDGEDNQSLDPVLAAKAAADHGVPVDALGFGTTAGTTLQLDGYSVHTALDEATLQAVTQASNGVYYAANSEQDPKQVYASLTPQLVIKPEAMEITSIFAGAGILMLLVGSAFSLLWFNRVL
jgi:Ca-activated chloride channel family protein